MIEIIGYELTDQKNCKVAFVQVRNSEDDLYLEMSEFKKGDRSWISAPSAGRKDPNNPEKYIYKTSAQYGPLKQEKFLEDCKKALNLYKEKFNNKGNEEIPF